MYIHGMPMEHITERYIMYMYWNLTGRISLTEINCDYGMDK